MSSFSHIQTILVATIASTFLTVQCVAYDLYNFDETITLEALNDIEQKSDQINSKKTLEKPYVIMVSLDGFRHDYCELHNAENLLEMKASGSYLSSLIPTFPSKTFPSHYTIATGLYPANHGLVSNTFHSRCVDAMYKINDRNAVKDGSWYGGTPLWVLAEQQEMLSASFFWVGSEATIKGYRPSHYFHFNAKVPYDTRVEKVIQWLELPEEKRPHMIFLYYSLTDTAGHIYGPTGKEMGKAVRYVDQMIGKLRNYIKQSNLPINLMVLSDHGMSEVNKTINIADFVDIGTSKFVFGPMAMIYTDSEAETQRIYRKLQNISSLRVYLNGALPNYLEYQNKDRIGDIVLATDPPYAISYIPEKKKKYHRNIATHGWDPYRNDDMGSIFIAEGPNIENGQVLSPVESVHIYPLVAEILGLNITEPIDGRPEVLAPLIRKEK